MTEDKVAETINQMEAENWYQEHKDAIDAYNKRIKQEGVFYRARWVDKMLDEEQE